MLKGIAASKGIVIAKVYKFEALKLTVNQKEANPSDELEKFNLALEKTRQDIEKIKERAKTNLSAEELAIFDAHLMVAADPELIANIEAMIQTGVNADYATSQVANNFVAIFESMDDAYMKERAADIRDVTNRLIANVQGVKIPDLSAIDEEVVVVAHDLTPSDTAQLNKEFIKGFITEIGGRTSHSAIMARSLEIPAIVGTKGILTSVNDNDLVVLDALVGEVLINPNEELLSIYRQKAEDFKQEQAKLKVLKDVASVTVDGRHVEIAANIGTPKDVEAVVENGGEGVGLYRSEFLYMDSATLPDEDTQFKAYSAVLKAMNGKRVVVRTLDIGGDKELPYLSFEAEMNPFLGYRAIRLCLDRDDIFRTQLRALIRASHYGKLAIMFPMIATVNEFRQARAIFDEEYAKLKAEGVAIADKIEVGMMVEIPSAAMLVDKFAKYSDFFSIGTNDLIQYSMAADRMNKNVSYLYQPYNPSLLRLIKNVIDNAHKHDRWVGMCGEMAGEEKAVSLLLGLGLDEFSMSASSMLKARQIVTTASYQDLIDVANQALEMETAEQVLALLSK